MPIWTGDETTDVYGYKFAKAEMQSKLVSKTSDGFVLKFRPGFSESIYAVLNTDTAIKASGLKFMVRISWTDSNGWDRYQDFVCEDARMASIYGNGKAIELTVTGVSAKYTNIKATLIAISDIGVEASGTVHDIVLGNT